MTANGTPQAARYISVAGIAAELGMKAPTLAQAIWRNPGHPVPPHDAEIEPGHGKGPDKGWLPGRIPEWETWRDSLPGRGAGGGRPRKAPGT